MNVMFLLLCPLCPFANERDHFLDGTFFWGNACVAKKGKGVSKMDGIVVHVMAWLVPMLSLA